MSARESRVRPEVVFAFATAMVMIAQQVAGKATRDALFLSNFPATDLPYAMMGAAAMSLAGTLLFASARSAHLGPARTVPIAFVTSAIFFVGEWLLVQRDPMVAAVVVYLHMAIFGAILISGFWSVVNERFDPYTAKSTVPKISAAAALGGVIGGLTAERVSELFGLPATLLGMALMHLFCALGVRKIGAPRKAAALRGEATLSTPGGGIGLLARTPYLRQMALLVVLCAIVDGLLDYALKSEAAAHFERADLIDFFAIFYAATGGLAFLLQITVGSALLRRVGIGGSLGVFPALVATGGAAAAIFGRFWGVVALRAGATLTSTSLYRSAFELLYTPVPPEEKRRTKVFIDVGATRVGDLLGGGLVFLVLTLLPTISTRTFVGLAAVAATLAIAVIAFLNRGYVRELADKLRSGSVNIKAADALDATTARTIAATSSSLNRETLLAELRKREAARQAREAGETSERADAPRDSVVDAHADEADEAGDPLPTEIESCVALLRGGDEASLLRFLSHGIRDARLAGFVIDRLGDPGLVDAATRYLRRLVDRIPGELTDTMLDPQRDLLVRRRIPRVLEVAESPRAMEALRHGLRANEFELRLRCGQAATRVVARLPSLSLSESEVDLIAFGELSLNDDTWARLSQRRPGSATSVLLSGGHLESVPRTMEHVFTVLALARDRDVMASTLGALYSGEPMIRGTALEYLETVLPDALCEKLFSRLDTHGSSATSERARSSIEDDLLRSSASLVLDRERLRRYTEDDE